MHSRTLVLAAAWGWWPVRDEVDLTHPLPESGPFQVRATALDSWGVGRVSDVFLVLVPDARPASEDDLRGQ